MDFKNEAKQFRFDLLDPNKGFDFEEEHDVCSI